MWKYIVKRILLLIPMTLAVILIIFFIMDLTPGTPAELILSTKSSPEAIQQLNEELGYNRPFFVRYADYVVKAMQGDMGVSYKSGRPVFEEIMNRFPTTLKLSAIALIIAVVVGIPLGVLSAVKQYSLTDFMGTTFAMIFASIPTFWLALMMVILFALKLRLLPSGGTETWTGYILPSICMAVPVIASLLRMTRTSMLESIRMDYIRTARAKGQKERLVVSKHALHNALLPVVTLAGTEFGALLGGVVTIEYVFSINGVGALVLDSIRSKDINMVAGSTIFLALSFMLLMLLVDVIYAFIDPRIKARYTK